MPCGAQNRSAPKCSLPRKCSRTQLTPQTRTGSTLGRLAVGLDQGLRKKLWRSVCSIGLNLYWGCCWSHCIVCWLPHHPDPISCSRLMQSTTVLQPTKTQPITSLCANGSINWRGTFFLLNFCNRLIGRVISPRERAKQSTGAQSTIRQSHSQSSPMIYSSQTLNKCSISPLNNPLKYPPAHCTLYETFAACAVYTVSGRAKDLQTH